MSKMRSNPFTLLEIMICFVILGIASSTIGWGIKEILEVSHFQKNVDYFVMDLKKAQILALSDRIDIAIHLQKHKGYYAYQLSTEESFPVLPKTPKKLQGIKQVQINDLPVDSHTLQIYSSGRIDPLDNFLFIGKNRRVLFDFQKSPMIELKQIRHL